MKYFVLAGLAIVLVFKSSAISAFDQKKFDIVDEVYLGPPVYPRKKVENEQAGFVEILAVVGLDGKVIEPVVLWSTDREFEKRALNAIKKYKLKPAKYDGVGVDSHYSKLIGFEISEQYNQVTREFKRLYDTGARMLSSDDASENEIKRIIGKLKSSKRLTPQGLAFIAFLEYMFSVKYDTPFVQYRAALKVIEIEKSLGEHGVLKNKELPLIKFRLIKTQGQLGYYKEAIELYNQLKEEDPQKSELLEPYIKEVTELIESGKPYRQSFSLDRRGNFFIGMTGSEFYVEDINGDIDRLQFRCQAKYKQLKFSQQNNYRVPKSWGNCLLQIQGDPKTEAKLVQMSSTLNKQKAD